MRLALYIEGGFGYFPGLKKPLVVDTASLDKEDADELCDLIDEADFFELPDVVGETPKKGADHQKYTLTASDSEREHSVSFYAGMIPGETTLHENIYSLMRFVREKGKRE
jgi:hypothetical protein